MLCMISTFVRCTSSLFRTARVLFLEGMIDRDFVKVHALLNLRNSRSSRSSSNCLSGSLAEAVDKQSGLHRTDPSIEIPSHYCSAVLLLKEKLFELQSDAFQRLGSLSQTLVSQKALQCHCPAQIRLLLDLGLSLLHSTS